MKIKNQIKEAELYVNRRIISSKLKLSALFLEFYDHNDSTSSFELGVQANVLTIGYLSGKIKVFLLNPDFNELKIYLLQ